jgi:diguanylate cyclase (GGDEF)-like protein
MMPSLLPYLDNATTAAFILLGLFTALRFFRSPSRSTFFLALAIVLLALVALANRLATFYASSLLAQATMVAFMLAGYSLLRFRASLIPLSFYVHVLILVALVGGLGTWLYAQQPSQGYLLNWTVLFLVLLWGAIVIEPILRFLRVAGTLPSVQAWRLRSLAFGLSGIIVILAFVVVSLALPASSSMAIAIEAFGLLLAPFLYIAFAPPAWLRRQWRASEEEGLRLFMQDLLVLEQPTSVLAEQSLHWAMRLVGGSSAALFRGDTTPLASVGLPQDQVAALSPLLAAMPPGVNRVHLPSGWHTLLALPIAVGQSAPGTLAIVAGPFTPSFGPEELSRAQQFMVAVAAALSWFNLTAISRIDPLTKVASRAHALERLEAMMAQGEPCCVAIMDLDHFKGVNDTFGHLAGDAVLAAASHRMTAALKPTDLVGRLSGEEFLFALPHTDLAQAQSALDRLLTSLSASPVAARKHQIVLTGSIGLTAYHSGELLDSLLSRADAALYQAKSEGRNRLVSVP